MKTRLMISAGLVFAVLPSLRADWCITVGATAAKYVGAGKQCGYATKDDAKAVANKLGYIDYTITGSDDVASTSTITAAPAARGHEFDSTINQAISAGVAGKISAGNAAGYVGLGILGNALFGGGGNQVDPAEQARQEAAQRAQQELQIEIQQLYNSGIWCLKQKNYSCAINEFQQALAKSPNDRNIINALALAKQKLKDTGVAKQNSGALAQLLGNAPTNKGGFDFDQLTHSSITSPNASALSLVNLDSSVVDLSGTTKTAVDPALVKNGSSATGTAQPLSQKDLDAQFDSLYNKSAVDQKTERQQLDAEFDKLYNRAELEKSSRPLTPQQLEDQKLDAEIDKLYNQAELDKQKERQQVKAGTDKFPNQPAPNSAGAGQIPQQTTSPAAVSAPPAAVDKLIQPGLAPDSSSTAKQPLVLSADEKSGLKDAPHAGSKQSDSPPPSGSATSDAGGGTSFFGIKAAKPTADDLKPADPVPAPGTASGTDSKGSHQLLSAAASSDLTKNYDIGNAKKAGALDFSTAYAMGEAIDPSTFSQRVKSDKRMIAALKQLDDLQATRFQLETETKQLTALRNAEKDPVKFKELDDKVKQADKNYQSNVKAVSDTTKVVEKLHREIDDEVETTPAPIGPAK